MPPLRLAIVFDEPLQPPDWCIRLVEQICGEPRVLLVALLRSTAKPSTPAANALIRCWGSLERIAVARPQSADRKSFAEAIEKVAVLSAQDHSAIAAAAPDVILDLSAGLGSDIPAGSARHGVWFADFLHPGAGFLTLASKSPTNRIALFRRTVDCDEPVAVAVATLNTKFIFARNALFMCEKAVPLVLRALRRTQVRGVPDQLRDFIPLKRTNDGIGDLTRYLFSLAHHTIRMTLDHVRAKVGRRPGMFFLKSAQCSWPGFDPASACAHVSGEDSYFADPFLWESEGQVYCFFEEYVYRTGRGHINVGRLVDGDLIDIEPVLKKDYHLSFPFLFEQDGQLYMLPETSEVRRLETWKCVEFPRRWEPHATALEGVAASDSTLNLIDGTWWLFTNISHDPFLDMNSELHIFRVDGPDLKSIEPHAFNPVVFDTLRARNAGRVFEMDGKLYRPGQDNSHGYYGYGLRLMEIRQLSLHDYEEVERDSIAPDFEPGIIGCHHLDVRGEQVIMDVRKRIGGRAR